MPWGRSGEYTSKKSGRTFIYRSTWERFYMFQLDTDPQVQSWDYEFETVKYRHDNVTKLYYPDFFVKYADGRTEIHEVGPEAIKLASEKCVLKHDACRVLCETRGWGFKIVDLSKSALFQWARKKGLF